MRKIKMLGDLRFEIDPEVEFGKWIDGNGLNFEKHVVAWLRDFLKPGMNVLDIGAQWGYYTVVCPMLLKKQCRVIAVEPNPYNLQFLLRNIELNDLWGIVEVLPLAASDGRRTLFYDNPKDWTGFVSPRPVNAFSFKVLTAPLDELLDESRRIDFVKLDVEGHEYPVLKGMAETLRRYRPHVHVEVNMSTSDRAGIGYLDPISFLASLDYRAFLLLEKDPGDKGTFCTTGELGLALDKIHTEKHLNVWDVIAIP